MVEVNERIILENGFNWLRGLDVFVVRPEFIQNRVIHDFLDKLEKTNYYEVSAKYNHWIVEYTYTKLDSAQKKLKIQNEFRTLMERTLNYKDLSNQEKKAIALEVLSRY